MSGTPVVDRRAFEDLVAEIVDPVRRYLLRRTDPDTADDVVGETLLVLWRRFGDIPEERVAWAIGVARGQLRNAQRSVRRQDRLVRRIATVDPPVESRVDPNEDRDEAVRISLDRLRAADAEILRLWAWDDLAPAQLSAVLGISANAATVRLHRARRRLAAELGKHSELSGHVEVREGRDR